MRATDGLSGKSHSVSLGPGGAIIKPPPLLPPAIDEASATGENPCVHQSSMGGRPAANGGSAPTVDRSADACPHKSEWQAEVAGLTA